MSFFVSTSASIIAGSYTVTLTGAPDLSSVRRSDALFIGGTGPYEVDTAYVLPGGERTISLKTPVGQTFTAVRCVVIPTAGDFITATSQLRGVSEFATGVFASLARWAMDEVPTVDIVDAAGTVHKVPTVWSLTESAGGLIANNEALKATVDHISPLVATLVQNYDALSPTVNGTLASAQALKEDADQAIIDVTDLVSLAGQSKEAAVNAKNDVDSKHSDVSGWHTIISNWVADIASFVKNTRTINGKNLSADVVLAPADIITPANAATTNAILGVRSKADQDLVANIFARMTLDLNFVDGVFKEHRDRHLYQLPLAEVIQCSRDTTAVEAGPLGLNTFDIGEPRFRYSPVNGQRLGLVTEPPTTNLIVASNDYLNAAWGKFDVSITADAQLAPDNTLTAERLTKTAVGYACIRQIVTTVVGSKYSMSFYARAVGVDDVVSVVISDSLANAISRAYVNLTTGVVTNSVGAGAPKAKKDVNGWWRIEISAVAVDTSCRCYIYPALFSEAAVRSIDIWGAQFELGEVTSFVPTGPAALTRGADLVRAIKTDFAQRRAMLYFEGVVVASGPSTDVDGLLNLNNNVSSNFLHISYNKQVAGGTVYAALSPVAGSLKTEPYTLGQPLKAAVFYDAVAGKAIAAINGSANEVSVTIPDSFWNALRLLNIGSYYQATNRRANSETKRVSYSTAPFTAAELALLTK